MRDYALLLAETVGLPPKQLRLIRFGAVLHDIGKILVPEAILTKSDPLSSEEWLELRRHPVIGAELLKNIPYLVEMIPIVLHHHEHWNGGGYPDGLGYQDIPLEARIVAIADGFDAMTTTRPYHPAWPDERAIQELSNGSGRFFDPELADTFIELWGKDEQVKQILMKYRNTLP